MFCTLIDRSLPNVHPCGNLAIRADGKEPINGWASSPRIEELRAAFRHAFREDLKEVRDLLADEVLVAHTTAVGGMYDEDLENGKVHRKI